MTNYLIVHGSYGSPDGNWFRWLEAALRADGDQVVVPTFPTPEGQNFNAWKAIADQALEAFLPAETVLIGHSSGAGFVLRLAEETEAPFKAIFSVCPFVRDLGLPAYDPINVTFTHHSFDWARIKKGATKITCFAGDDDAYVPLAYTKEVAENLEIELIVIKNGGHLNAESGYFQFPLLLEKIRT